MWSARLRNGIIYCPPSVCFNIYIARPPLMWRGPLYRAQLLPVKQINNCIGCSAGRTVCACGFGSCVLKVGVWDCSANRRLPRCREFRVVVHTSCTQHPRGVPGLGSLGLYGMWVDESLYKRFLFSFDGLNSHLSGDRACSSI